MVLAASLSFAAPPTPAVVRKTAAPRRPVASKSPGFSGSKCVAGPAGRGGVSRSHSAASRSSRRNSRSGTPAMLSSLSPTLPRVALQSLFFAAAIAAAAVFAGAGDARAAFSTSSDGGEPATPKNVLGQELGVCSTSPMTGYMRNGRCETGPTDFGTHTVCAKVTTEFLEYTRGLGNDLVTPRPEYRFPGLKEGDGWCLCASRWREAMMVGVAPPVVLEASHDKTLQYVELAELQKHAVSVGRDTQ